MLVLLEQEVLLVTWNKELQGEENLCSGLTFYSGRGRPKTVAMGYRRMNCANYHKRGLGKSPSQLYQAHWSPIKGMN